MVDYKRDYHNKANDIPTERVRLIKICYVKILTINIPNYKHNHHNKLRHLEINFISPINHQFLCPQPLYFLSYLF